MVKHHQRLRKGGLFMMNPLYEFGFGLQIPASVCCGSLGRLNFISCFINDRPENANFFENDKFVYFIEV
jgi:hypothetical protein